MSKSWKTVTHDSKNPRHNALRDTMNDIARSHNKGTLHIWNSIVLALEQAQLEKAHSAISILEYSYRQGLVYLEQGHAIENPMAWMRLTCFRRIRTLRKDPGAE